MASERSLATLAPSSGQLEKLMFKLQEAFVTEISTDLDVNEVVKLGHTNHLKF